MFDVPKKEIHLVQIAYHKQHAIARVAQESIDDFILTLP